MKTRVVTAPLRLAEHLDDYRLHRAALEWSLAEPIIINAASDIKSRVDWQDRVKPFHHQVQNLMRFCRRLPVTLLADDVGLGKTISAGLIISELMKRNRINKVAVICPKILMPQWAEELESKFGIAAYGATGAGVHGVAGRREPVFVTTYHSAASFLKRASPDDFDMLILDEAHKVRNLHGTPSPPQMAKAIYRALEARTFKYVLMLTATPIQNRLWDIYSLIDCLAVARGHRNPLGRPEQFVKRFIADGKTQARRLQTNRVAEFRKIVGGYMARTRRIDAKLAFPEREVRTYPVQPSAEEQDLQSLVAREIGAFNPLVQTSLLTALMSSPQALAAQLVNMEAKGSASSRFASEVGMLTARVSRPAKAAHVMKIAKNLRSQRDDWRMVVFTTRTETQQMLGDAFAGVGIAHGFIKGGASTANRTTIESFRKKRPDIHVVISTDAGAEGVNLQAANVLVNYDLPWNPMVVEQRIGRVQRIGSNYKSVWVANVVHRNSPEERIVGRLMEKLQVIAHTVGDIEAVLEASGDAEGTSLEQQIREMVIASLQGQNQDHAARLAAESIEQAQSLLEEQQEQMDEMLGSMDDSDKADLPMPRLKPAAPSMPLEDFVLQALEREGCEVTGKKAGLYQGRNGHGQRIEFTFDARVMEEHTRAGVFMGRVPQLYQPGKPDFERLVQKWADRSAAWGRDARRSAADVEQTAQGWVETVPGATFLGVKASTTSPQVRGSISCLTRVGNAVDSYEKLLTIPVSASAEHSQPPVSGESIDPEALFLDIEGLIDTAVAKDPDIRRFREFYEQRLEKELANTDRERRARLENDLAPSVVAEAAGLEYEIAGGTAVDVAYQFTDKASYRSRLVIEGGVITREPPRYRCAVTAATVPDDCLETCQVTGERALREVLVQSGLSGAYALPEKCLTCGLTGKRILPTEAETCALTGAIASREAMVRSDISGRHVTPERASRCELTGAKVADDELLQSSVSGRWFRSDEAASLAEAAAVAHISEVARCEFSGLTLPKGQCGTSEFSGKTLAKSRMVTSQLSQRKGDKTELVTCAESGTQGLPDELVQSSVSGDWMLPKHAVTMNNGKLARPHEVAICQWTNACVPKQWVATCRLTGLTIAKKFLNEAGEFEPLREALDGRLEGRPFPDSEFFSRQAPDVFRGNTPCQYVLSPAKDTHILFGEKSFFGFNRRVFAAIAAGDLSGLSLLCRPLMGRRTKGKWKAM